MQQKIIDVYNNKIADYSAELKKLKKENRITSYLRAILFASAIILLYYSNTINYYINTFVLFSIIVLFLFLVKKNLKLKKAINKCKHFIEINKNEISALNGKWNVFHAGKEYINFEHHFTYDLDIFGEGSLFQYLNRTSTIAGKNKLTNTISNINLSKNSIEQRQAAIKELSNIINFRQNFTATSLTIDEKFNTKINQKEDHILNNLLKWTDQNINFINKKVWKFILPFLPSVTILLLGLSIFEILPYSFMGLSALLNLSIVGIFLKRINLEHSKLGKTTKSLNKIKELIKIIEFTDFKTNHLQKLKQSLIDKSSFSRLQKLNKLLETFDLRLNMIAGVLLNAFLLLDLQVIKRLEQQKKYLNKNLENWFNIVGEFDALISLANFNYNNPNYVFPKIDDKNYILKLKNAGHPLINANNMISNDFNIKKLQIINIITGANMAGKSTFLRTVGINMVLASAGSSVCATEMIYYPINIFTSVRTNDSLQKNESYFYAELMRLKQITDKLKIGNELFIIVDEMLRGTNSKDKHKGSYEFIKQVIKYKVVGLIATHDIQLGKLIKEFPDNIKNKRFEVEIINDEVVFDYKIKDGISQNLNASFLMKKYGIIE